MTSLNDVNSSNLGIVKIIINKELPLSYPASFYQEICTPGHDIYFSKIANFNGIPVGAIKAKLLSNKQSKILSSGVYIECIAVLKHYRNRGIAMQLLNYVEENAKKHYQHRIFVHVLVDNILAIEWYKNHGFELKEEILRNYYKDIKESSSDAYIMEKVI